MEDKEKLKTLEEIRESVFSQEFLADALRTEAVKWVKEDTIDCMNGTITPYRLRCRWMHRLNITEEDME